MKRFIIYCIQLIKQPVLLLRHTHVPLSTRINNNVLLVGCSIGKYCYIGQGGIMNNVKMGNYCSIAPNVIIGGMEHSYWAPSTSTHLSDECISDRITIIGNDVWIGANAVVKQGVTIGDGAIIGAGSIVTKDVLENSIVCGNPAKVLKKRMDEDKWQKIKQLQYWALDKKEAKKIISEL